MMLLGKLAILLITFVAQAPLPPARHRLAPPRPAQTFRIKTDNVPQAEISGVILPAHGQAKGTLFFCHGLNRQKEDFYGWEWVRRELGWNIVLFDFREHGESSRTIHVCTLGYYEIWDVKAVVDHAEALGLAKPYAIYGMSMGASTGIRWASQDTRISGVLALSPYRNGLRACTQYARGKWHVPFDDEDLHPGLRKMLGEVDLPTSVAKRNDLRLWILVGQRDYFPVSDERAILDASPAPAAMKHLFVIPGGYHYNLWSWRGNKTVPAHDRILRDFLDECQRTRR